MINIKAHGIDSINRILKKHMKELDRPRQFFKDAVAIMQGDVKDHFSHEKGPNRAWERLKQSTLLRRRGGSTANVLQDTGRLRQSVIASGKSTGTYAVVGTNVKYAPTHQFGARKGKFGADRHGRKIPWGNIPARPFLWLSRSAGEKMQRAMLDQIDKI